MRQYCTPEKTSEVVNIIDGLFLCTVFLICKESILEKVTVSGVFILLFLTLESRWKFLQK